MGNATSVTIRNSSSIYEWVKSRFSTSGNSSDVNASASVRFGQTIMSNDVL